MGGTPRILTVVEIGIYLCDIGGSLWTAGSRRSTHSVRCAETTLLKVSLSHPDRVSALTPQIAIRAGILSGLRAHLPPFPHIITAFAEYNPFDVFSGASGNRKASALSKHSPDDRIIKCLSFYDEEGPAGDESPSKSETIDLIGSPPHKFPSSPPKLPLPLSHPARARAGWVPLLRRDRSKLSTRRLPATFNES